MNNAYCVGALLLLLHVTILVVIAIMHPLSFTLAAMLLIKYTV